MATGYPESALVPAGRSADHADVPARDTGDGRQWDDRERVLDPFFASDDWCWVTGQTLMVDGGIISSCRSPDITLAGVTAVDEAAVDEAAVDEAASWRW